MSGSELITEVTNASYEAEGGIYTHEVEQSTNPAQRAASYPTSAFKNRSPMDEEMQQRAELVEKYGATTPFGQLTVGDKELDWIAQKRETAEAANLDAWIGANFNVNDVATRAWLQRVYPQFYERREEDMTRRAKFALRVHLLKMRGPRNRKDLILQWGLQTGRIKLDRDWDRIAPGKQDGEKVDSAAEQQRYMNGLFSIRRFQTDGERKENSEKLDNPFATQDARQAQRPGPFPGYGVVAPRYPQFLEKIIGSQKTPVNAAPPAPVANP